MIATLFPRALAAVAAGAALSAVAVLSGFGQPDPLTPPANGPRKADPTWNALCNATVHVRPGEVLEHATVVIRAGRITSVQGTPAPAAKPDAKGGATPDAAPKSDAPKGGKAAEPPKDDISKAPPPPPGARVWDCTGLHIYAGFIDPYVEVDLPPLPADAPGQHWNPRVTPQRSALEARGPDAATAESLRKIGFTAAAIAPRGGLFRGAAALVSLAKPEDDRSLARPPVYAENVYQMVALDAGRGGFGGGDSNANSNWPGYPNSQMGAIALLRQTFIDADWQAAARASGAFHDETNCLDFLAPESAATSSAAARPSTYVFNTDDELEVFRAIKIAEEFNRPLAIVGSGTEFRRLAGMVHAGKSLPAPLTPPSLRASERSCLPLIVPLNFPDPPKVGTIGEAEHTDLRDLMTWEQAPTNPRRLEQAGFYVSLTTSKIRGDRGKFRENLRKSIAYGLSEDQALAMVTTRPAQFLGAADRMGAVQQGMLANLVVADGDYFAKKTQLRDVWVDGDRYELNTAPSSLKGEWEVTLNPAPEPDDGGSIKVTYSIDKDNNLTIRAHLTSAAGEQSTKKATAKNVRVESSGYGVGTTATRISFTFDHQPFGSAGVFTESGVVEGDTILGEGVRADGERFLWSARRVAAEPASDPESEKGFAGTWRLTEDMGQKVDAAAVEAGDFPTMVIDRDNTVTIKVHGQEYKADTTKIEGKTITTTIKGEPFGWEGEVSSTGTLDKDTIAGTSTLADGTKRTWTFTRAPDVRRGGRGARGQDAQGDHPAPDKPADAVSGTWAGNATGPQLPEPIPFTLKLKLAEDGKVTGNISSHLGTHDVTDGSFSKSNESSGTLTFKIVPPDAGAITFNVKIAADSMTGAGSGGDMAFTLTANRSAKEAASADEDEDTAPKDIPETYGYPFGPYGLNAIPAQESVLLVNATIWTSGPQGVIRGGWMLVQDGKISSLGPGKAEAPPGVRVIDCAGKQITPGLIDCHSHTGISRGVNESGEAVTAEVRIQDVTDPDSMSWYWQLAGGLTCVNSLHGSANPIGGQNCVNKIRWGALEPDDMHLQGAIPGIKFALGENVKQSNWSNSGTRYPQTRMGVETLMRDRFTAAREYLEEMKRRTDGATKGQQHEPLAASAPRTQAATESASSLERVDLGVKRDAPAGDDRGDGPTSLHEAATATSTSSLQHSVAPSLPPRRDLELEALGEVLEGKRLVHCHSYRQDEVLMLCRIARDFGFKIGTFQHILEGYKVADEVRDYSGGGSCFSDWWAYKVEVQDAIPYDGAIMHDVGVCVSFNSDSDELARRMNAEAGKAVKYGDLAPEEALKFVTINPARQLRIDNHVGSLEPGKDADFVIWSVPAASAYPPGADVAGSGAGDTRQNATPPAPSGTANAAPPPALRAGAPSHPTVDGTPLSAMARCEQTWIDGRCYFSLERDAELRKADAATRNRIIQKLLASGAKRGGPSAGEGRPSGPPGAGPPGGRRRRPVDELTSGAGVLDQSAATPESFVLSMLRQAADQRRERFLQLWRMGIDPSWSRCGDCGESMGGAQ